MTTLPASPTPVTIRLVDRSTSADSIAPTLINEYSAFTIPAYWRAMNFTSENLASFTRYVQRDGARLPRDEKHPIDALLGLRPNAYQSGYVFWRTFFLDVANVANGYARVQRDARGVAIGLHNLQASDVLPFRYTLQGEEYPTQFYLIRSTKTVLLGSDVVHIMGLSTDGMIGLDPIAVHEATLQRSATLGAYQTKYFTKGTNVRATLEYPTGVTMTDEQLQSIKNYLRTHFFGMEADEDVLITTNGGTLKNQTMSPQESQLVEQTAASVKQIAQITGVDPAFLFEKSESKYTGIEEAGQNVVRYHFRPWIEQTEDELTIKLLSPADRDAGLSVGINADVLLRGDTKTQTDTVNSTVTTGVRTANEGRALLGLPKSTDADADKLKRTGDTSPAPATNPQRNA